MKKSQHKSPPAFLFYVKDFLTSSTVMAMDLTEIGALIKLLCVCWINDGLPVDDRSVSKILSIDEQTFSKIWPNVKQAFVEVDGKLRNRRLDEERKRQISRSEINRQNSLKAVAARQARQKKTSQNDDKNSVTVRSSNGNHSNSNSNSNSNVKKNKFNDLLQKKIEVPTSLNKPEFLDAWKDWQGHLQEKKSRPTNSALKKQLAKCEKIGVVRAIKMINYSIERNYQGLFEKPANQFLNSRSKITNITAEDYLNSPGI